MSASKPYVLLLTSRPAGWASTRFRSAARERGVRLRAADPTRSFLEVEPDGVSVRIAGRKLHPPVSVLPRLGPGNYEDGLATLGHLEASGVPACNSREAIDIARDTLRGLLALKSAGLRVPRTARLLSIKDLRLAARMIPGPPWILKTFTGAMGIGTMRVMERDQLEAVAATLWALKQPILLQEFVRSADGSASDIRALAIGGRILGAIRRRAEEGEFRANVHRGGKPEKIDLTRKDEKAALRAARAVGLGIAGVDWIRRAEGPVFLEVNATPGFRGFETATGLDVAGAMIEYASELGGLE